MSWYIPAQIGQMSMDIMMWAIFFVLYWSDKKQYLYLWGISWFFWSLKFAAETAAAMQPNPHWLLTGCVVCCWVWASYFFTAGMYRFLDKEHPSSWLVMGMLLSIWGILATAIDVSFMVTHLPSSLFTAIIYIKTGLLVLSAVNRKTTGRLFIGSVILLAGVHSANFPLSATITWVAPWGYLAAGLLKFATANGALLLYYQRVQGNLTKSEAALKLIADNVYDVIFHYRIKPTSSMEYVSPSIERMSGYTAKEFYQNPKLVSSIIHPKDSDYFQSIGNKAQENDRVRLRLVRKDLRIIWVEMILVPVQNEGNTIAIEGIARDITQQKEQEDELRQLHESRKRLFSAISHDLRTPITAIQGYSEALLDQVVTEPAEVESFLRTIHTRAINLNRLINDLFDLARLEIRQISFLFEEVALKDFLDDIAAKYQQELNRTALEFASDLHANSRQDKLFIHADIGRMNQVFSNIISNAIRHTSSGGKITLKANLVPKIHQIIISISDTGNGIPKADLPYVFDLFYRSSDKNNSGAGLGLAIAKEIVQSHEGLIWVESEPGHGTTFFISLPVIRLNEGEKSACS